MFGITALDNALEYNKIYERDFKNCLECENGYSHLWNSDKKVEHTMGSHYNFKELVERFSKGTLEGLATLSLAGLGLKQILKRKVE